MTAVVNWAYEAADGEDEQVMEGSNTGDVGGGLGEEFSGFAEGLIIAGGYDNSCLH
jgi:hypothetical protein